MIFTQNYMRITEAMGMELYANYGSYGHLNASLLHRIAELMDSHFFEISKSEDKWRENQQFGKYQFKSNFSADLVYDKQKQPVLSPQVLIPPLQTISAGQQRVLNYEAAQL